MNLGINYFSFIQSTLNNYCFGISDNWKLKAGKNTDPHTHTDQMIAIIGTWYNLLLYWHCFQLCKIPAVMVGRKAQTFDSRCTSIRLCMQIIAIEAKNQSINLIVSKKVATIAATTEIFQKKNLFTPSQNHSKIEKSSFNQAKCKRIHSRHRIWGNNNYGCSHSIKMLIF